MLGTRPHARILIEASTDSEWVARCLEALGHEVIVADPNFAPMYATRSRKVKTDRRDARALAEACLLGAYRPDGAARLQPALSLVRGPHGGRPDLGRDVFTKNRQRLLDGDIARAFFDSVVAHAREHGLLSDEHFTVDGTLIEAWASLKSFRRTDAPPAPPDDLGNPTVNFHGERRSNATHASTTHPDARLFRKGDNHEARLYYQGHVLMENRHGLAVDGSLTPATGFAEREQALAMATQLPPRATLGADKSYDTRDFVDGLRGLAVTPHVAQNTTHRASAIDGRTTRHVGYLVSQRERKRIEEIFGWLKQIGLLRKTRHRGVARVGWMFTFGLAVYNLVRMRNLAGQPT